MNTLFERYGEDIQLLDAEGEKLRDSTGFVQPMHMEKLSAHRSATPGGSVRSEEFLLIAAPDAFAGTGAEKTVVWQSRRFTVMRAEKAETPPGAAHWEAILCPEGRRLL